ncbi:MAG: hypothetical protein ACLFUS_17740 [Candidatus Sumerlaeia bacterium]
MSPANNNTAALIYQPGRDLQSLRRAYAAYEVELQLIEKQNTIHEPPYWWESGKNISFFYVKKRNSVHGFVIVAYGEHVDADVASEICEIWIDPICRDARVFSRLMEAAIDALQYPAGFQVFRGNVRGTRLFENLLNRRNVSWNKWEGRDGSLAVVKYRIPGKND